MWQCFWIKTDGWEYAIPFQLLPYNHNTRIWVGLNWKFICLSMGSLTWKRGEAEATSWKWMTYPSPMQFPGWRLSWLGGQAHRGGAYTRVCNWKVMVDYPHTMYVESGLSWRMYRMLWWKCTTSAEGRNYSNSRVRGHGRLERPYDSVVRCFQNDLWLENGDFDLTTAELWNLTSRFPPE